jgi:hypothetical protein
MKKHIAAALAVVLALSALALPSTAYASDTATMDVTLTLTEDDVTPPSSTPPDEPNEPEPSGPDYVVHIPASISLNEQKEVLLTWENYTLEGYDTVLVYINATKTFIGEAF